MPEPLPPCPYTILGVAKDAQLPEIRTAYRKLVLKCHPDKVTDAKLKEQKADEFQKVQQAYELLNNEDERTRYDDRVRLQELRKRAGAEPNTSAPRTPPRYYDVRTAAEPRPDIFKTKTSSRAPSATGSRVYSQYPSSRSYEDEIHNASPRHYEEAHRSARRATSYDERPSKREEEREREKERERDRRRRKEDQEERNRLAAKAEKEALRAEKEARKQEKLDKEMRLKQKEKADKAADKARKREAADKMSHRQPYMEPYPVDDEPQRISKSDRKKTSSSSKKHDEKDRRDRERSMSRDVSQQPFDETVASAIRYMTTARAKHPPISRHNTISDPYSTHRRSSDTPAATTSKTRDRSAHKNSATAPKDIQSGAKPTIVDPEVPRIPPQFAKAGTTPPSVPDSPPRSNKLPRSQTMRESDRHAPPHPHLARAQTYHYPGEADPRMAEPRGRGRSRLQAQVDDDESDSDFDHHRRAYEQHKREQRRHKNRSPQDVTESYTQAYAPTRQPSTTARYSVSKNNRAVPIMDDVAYAYPADSPPPKSKSASYYSPSNVRHTDYAPQRPPMPSRESMYSQGSTTSAYRVRRSEYDDVQYASHMAQPTFREEAYGRA